MNFLILKDLKIHMQYVIHDMWYMICDDSDLSKKDTKIVACGDHMKDCRARVTIGGHGLLLQISLQIEMFRF